MSPPWGTARREQLTDEHGCEREAVSEINATRHRSFPAKQSVNAYHICAHAPLPTQAAHNFLWHKNRTRVPLSPPLRTNPTCNPPHSAIWCHASFTKQAKQTSQRQHRAPPRTDNQRPSLSCVLLYVSRVVFDAGGIEFLKARYWDNLLTAFLAYYYMCSRCLP